MDKKIILSQNALFYNKVGLGMALAHLTFHDWISFQDLLLNPGVLSTDCSQELQDEFGGLCLPSTTLSTDDHALVPLSSLHEVVGVVRCSKDVWCFFADLFVLVPIDV